MDLWPLLADALPREQFNLLESAGGIAQEEGVRLYLVGGAVRDLLLGRAAEDLDLAVEGDSETLAYVIAKRLSGQVVSRSQFSTAKLKVDGVSLDLNTARNERYSRPGALPQVAHGTMAEDLGRRDFSINAMAFPLHLQGPAELLDPFGGQQDLEQGIIRVLHDDSFVDDATRILRAVRYMERLSFRLEEHTNALLVRDLPMLNTISGDRARREIQLWLKEERPLAVLLRAAELGVLAAFHPALAGSVEAVRRAAGRLGSRRVEEQAYVGLLAFGMTPDEGEGLILRLGMSPRWATVVRDTIALQGQLSGLGGTAISPVELYDALAHIAPPAVQACALATTDDVASENLVLFLEKLRHVKPALSGSDIVALGIGQGPAVGEMLRRLRRAQLEGVVTTRSDEMAMVKDWLTTQREQP